MEKYNSNTGFYTVRLLSTSKPIEKGMIVVTSGMGGVFPSGILIGYVDSINEKESSLGISYNVVPSVDFSSIRFVNVVKRITEYDIQN